MTTEYKVLADVMNEDLNRFQIRRGYMLILKHGLMGVFPAIITENTEPVVCLDKELLKKAGLLLPERPFTVVEIIMLASAELAVGFNVSNDVDEKTKPFFILTETEFERRVKDEERPFRWAPGLIGAGMDREHYVETLETALGS
ncbi:hypothetical protein HQ571_02275 [Candidatus Kuenenbacteria bacterium]|nr:hypothetical protein [Candidatus Kuenenbacteria bacterium]